MKRDGEVVTNLADRIRTAILEGAFKPGEPLREATIINRFGCSRASAREALRLIIHSGLTVKTPNQSYRVSQFDERDLYELTTLRLQLERLGARIAFGREDLVQGLSVALDELRDAVARGHKIDAFKANRHFHEAIIKAADHRRLTQAYARIGDQIEFAFLSLGQLRRDIDRLVAEHEILLELARSGTVDEFLEELTYHIQGGLGGSTTAGDTRTSPSRATANDPHPSAAHPPKVSDNPSQRPISARVGNLGW